MSMSHIAVADLCPRGYTVVDNWILAAPLTIAQKMCIIALRRYAWQGSQCHPSIARLARDTSLSRATVHRTLAQLVRLGLLRIESRAAAGRPSLYVLLPPPAELVGAAELVGVSHHETGVSHHETGVSHHETGVSHHETGVSHHEIGVSHGETPYNNTQYKTQYKTQDNRSRSESESGARALILARWTEVWGARPRRLDEDTVERMDQMLGMHALGQLGDVRRPVAYLRSIEPQEDAPRWSQMAAEQARRAAAEEEARRRAAAEEEAILAAERAAREEWAAMPPEERARWRGYAHWRAMGRGKR
jgi:DNA-binding MarR family transcriptional regulator